MFNIRFLIFPHESPLFHCHLVLLSSPSCHLDLSQFFLFFFLCCCCCFHPVLIFFLFRKELKAKQGKTYLKGKGWCGGQYLEVKTTQRLIIIQVCNRCPVAKLSCHSGSQQGAILPFKGHLEKSKDILVITICGEGQPPYNTELSRRKCQYS